MSNSIRWNKVCILGVGLLGGSIAMALRARSLAIEIVGWGRDPTKLRFAVEKGILDEASIDLHDIARDCDLLIAATPVQQIISCLSKAWNVADKDCLLLDVGSTKSSIANESMKHPFANRFCPSHPIAGSEKSGAEYSTPDLFVEKCAILTPTALTSPDAISQARLFWESIGSRVLQMTPSEHDSALANTSHLPHLLASVLASITPKGLLPVVGSGWSDATRIASGDPQLWTQIVEENSRSIVAAMEKFSEQWNLLLKSIEQQDYETIQKILESGKAIRDSIGTKSKL